MRAVRRHHNRKQFTSRLVGKKFTGVERRGKYLLCRLDGDDVLVIHLGMSGQLLRDKTARDPMAKHTHVVITFTQGGQLRFVDPRTFGEMFVTEVDDVEKQVTELAHLGIDPLETAMSWDHFGSLLAQRHAKLKPLLMDQKFIAGIGNIYSDEILLGAGLRWDRMSDSLSAAGGAPALPRDDRDAPGRGEVPRLVARRRAVRRPLRQARRVPAVPQGVRARGRGLPALPPRRRPRALRRPLHLLLRRVPGLSNGRERIPARVSDPCRLSDVRSGCRRGRVQGVWFRESCREQAVARA